MNPIIPPTDNLYKFVAVFGLLIALVSMLGVSYHYNGFKNHDNKYVLLGARMVEMVDDISDRGEANRSMMLDLYTSGQLAERVKVLSEDSTLSRYSGTSIPYYWLIHKRDFLKSQLEGANGRSERLIEIASLDAQIHDYLDTRKVDSLLVEVKVMKLFREHLEDRFIHVAWFYFVGIFLGVILSAVGMALWYMRQQKHEDSILEKRVAREPSPGSVKVDDLT